jgi:hypothetical protein
LRLICFSLSIQIFQNKIWHTNHFYKTKVQIKNIIEAVHYEQKTDLEINGFECVWVELKIKNIIEAVHYEQKTDLELECVWVELKIKFKKVLYGTFPSEQLGRLVWNIL